MLDPAFNVSGQIELAIAISTQQKCQFSDFICFQYYRAELYKSDMKKI